MRDLVSHLRLRSMLGVLPPPLAGEGWGEGERQDSFAGRLDLIARPLPIPPPQAGEGIDRLGGVMMHRAQMRLR
jgi:hypothetical protein